MPTRRLIAIPTLLIVLSSCTASPPLPEPDRDQVKQLLNAEALFGLDAVDPLLPEEQLLALDAQMRFFVQEHVPRVLSPRARLSYLLDAMMRPAQLGLEYEPGITSNARQTFYQRRGNCLSLSSLFIALAREAGLDAYYNEVTVPPSWDMLSDNRVAFYQHINAAVDFGEGDIQVVDLSVDNYDYHYPQTPISDQRAAAQHYNNRAVEKLGEGDTASAYQYLHRALYLAPQAGHIWGNLGTVFRRDGHLGQAALAYRQALALDHHDSVALGNLARLYREIGDAGKASQLEARALAFQQENPFWHFSRAKGFYEAGQFQQAAHSINKAIRLNGDEYRFYQMAGLVYRRLGDYSRAQVYNEKAAGLRLSEEH